MFATRVLTVMVLATLGSYLFITLVALLNLALGFGIARALGIRPRLHGRSTADAAGTRPRLPAAPAANASPAEGAGISSTRNDGPA